jgi:hypothetical protein
MGDFGDFLTNQMRNFISDQDFDREFERARFNFIFDVLNDSLGDNAFRRYYPESDRFSGAFSVSAFEAITSGLARNYSSWLNIPSETRLQEVATRVRAVWADDIFKARSGGGKRANYRIPYMVEVGERLFRVE